MKTRYQHSKLHVKAYRWLRHKPGVPFFAIRVWWSQRKEPLQDEEGFPRLRFRDCWGLANGYAEAVGMNHVYSMEEVFGDILGELDD